MDRLRQALASGKVILLDGGIGTALLRRGLPPSRPLESGNVLCPETVLQVHHAYRQAGALALTSNTFLGRPTANPLPMPEGCDWATCTREGVRLARRAAGTDGFVLASVGPPLPNVPLSDALEDAVSQVRTMESLDPDARPDAVLLETQSDLVFVERLLDRLQAETETACPVLVSFTYRGDADVPQLHPSGRLPEEAARVVHRHRERVLGLGVNCGRELGLEGVLEVLRRYRTVTDLPLLARPNAGTPTPSEQGPHWPVTPSLFAAWSERLARAGVALLGGCCGTTPEHIAAAWQRLVGLGMLFQP